MVDFNLLEQYFNTFITFDFGNMTLTAILVIFGTALTWLTVKAIVNIFII